MASCSCFTAALCSWARCLSDAMLCDLRSSPFSFEPSTLIFSSIIFAFLCMPSNHGAELDVRWGGRGREWRTIAPYRPYSAMMELWPQHFSFLRHFARRFWNQTWRKEYTDINSCLNQVKICRVGHNFVPRVSLSPPPRASLLSLWGARRERPWERGWVGQSTDHKKYSIPHFPETKFSQR